MKRIKILDEVIKSLPVDGDGIVTNLIFSHCRFTNLDITSSIDNCNFTRCSFENVNFATLMTKVKFESCTFKNCEMQSRLNECKIVYCDDFPSLDDCTFRGLTRENIYSIN